MTTAGLVDPRLEHAGVAHGFGTLGAPVPDGVLRPKQVHGVAVAELAADGSLRPVEADAVVCRRAGVPIGVVTADCVPILVAAGAGDAVAAIHAGWRGLAAGVVGAAITRLRSIVSGPGAVSLDVAIGPHIRRCCYEIDAPVVSALAARFGAAVEAALAPARPGHHWLDLEQLVAEDLIRAGVPRERISSAVAACTACDARRFASYRRDGARAGRLLHWIAARRSA